MTVKRTELLEAEPLPLLKPPKPRLVAGLVGVAVFTLLGFLGGDATFSLGFFALAMWLVYAGWVLLEARAFIQARGTVLKVRTYTRMHEVHAQDVVGLKHQFNGRRPDFQLLTRQGRPVWVPASKFERGHATLFAWLGWFVPDAELDEKSKVYRDVLVKDGLI